MNEKQEQSFLLAILVLMLIAVNYNFLGEKFQYFLEDSKTGVVERVIDGDTVVLENDEHVRLLGINTPEKGEKYSQEAKEFLESRILNKTVVILLGKEKKDLYGRTLGYVKLDGKNVNLEVVENGFANFYFPSGKDKHYGEFKEAWDSCISSNANLCERSNDACSGCIILKEFDHKNQKVSFYNQCPFECGLNGWTIKDEGRKKFVFPEKNLGSYEEIRVIVGNDSNADEKLFWRGESYVWTSTGDTLFLRDREGKLVLWQNY